MSKKKKEKKTTEKKRRYCRNPKNLRRKRIDKFSNNELAFLPLIINPLAKIILSVIDEMSDEILDADTLE